METEIIIAADDPVRLVSAVVERMDIRKIERSYFDHMDATENIVSF